MNAYVLLSPRQALIAWLRVILLMLVIFALSRLSLILTNGDLWPSAPVTDWLASFSMGLRFDLRMAVYGSLPMVFLPLVPFVWYQRFCGLWVSLFTLAYVFSGVLEIEFYGEFQQRLNGLVLQYIKEDPETVLRMVWEGLPVFRYTLLFVVISAFFIWLIRRIFNQPRLSARPGLLSRLGVFLLIFVLATVWARGSLRSGPPLRWGDAFVTDHTFLNHLALNGSFTLAKAMMNFAARDQTGAWIRLEDQAAADTTRSMLALPPAAESRRARENLEVVNEPNVVVIILESFSGQYTGALGNPLGVTPAFDALAAQGLLFTRAFSNGTHTHQGIFATLSCFPNLPGYEYLMQQPEGRNQFMGLTRVHPERPAVFVYNGDFNWDNQLGFFRNQGLKDFVGRYDFRNPVHIDPAWGVSDQDMFDRALTELSDRAGEVPFVGILQTLSNHLPYSLPEPLQFDPVMIDGEMSERLTAMKYSDWALGEFFRKARSEPWFDNTLFVILGDHGFGTEHQLTEVNLLRFHIPVLMYGKIPPSLQGRRLDTVISQVDVIPTLSGLMGEPVTAGCWGRDVFATRPDDAGQAVIKPSGGEQVVAYVQGDRLVTLDESGGGHLYEYDLAEPAVQRLEQPEVMAYMVNRLLSYVQTGINYLNQKPVIPGKQESAD